MVSHLGNLPKLEQALRQLRVRPSADPAWTRPPSVRVIDCVLSLNRHYDRFVVPRLNKFELNYPTTKCISGLHDLMSRYPSAEAFVSVVLNYRDPARAAILASVVNWLTSISGHGTLEQQYARLTDWARSAPPNQYKQLGIRGFGLAGFQYLRMLFEANTTKPDIHICRFVEATVGRRVSPLTALTLLEKAATNTGTSLRDMDTTIWERSARRN